MVFDKIKRIIVDTLNCDEDDVKLETDLKNDIDADSLDAVELIMAAEDEFGIEIPDEVAMNMKTVKDIVDHIEKNI